VLADGGTLALLDAPALPLDAQDALVRSIARRASAASGSTVEPAGLVIASQESVEALVTAGRLSRGRGSLVEGAEVAIPALADRAEDLRALVLDRLAAAGLSSRAEPRGIDPAALRLLVEHTWPGNDTELADVLNRASAIATGPVVTAADLAVIGFRPLADVASLPTPPPSASRRRPRAGSGSRRR
jgi:DNA-binding NtrC family response regulator